MDIKEIVKEKRELESFILHQLKKFESNTGVKIDSVELHKLETVSINLGIREVEIFCRI